MYLQQQQQQQKVKKNWARISQRQYQTNYRSEAITTYLTIIDGGFKIVFFVLNQT